MRCVLVSVLALCVFASAFPRAAKDEDTIKEDEERDTELVIVPLQRGPVRRPSFSFGLADDLEPPPSFLNQHPLFRSPWDRPANANDEEVDDFMTQMQTMVTEMRRQITEILNRSHSERPGAEEAGSDVGFSIGDSEVPKNKSTSTTKVIDGHVVTVNETTYSSGDDNIGAVFRIKVVEVKPSENPEAEGKGESEERVGEQSTAAPREPELTTAKSELDEDNHEDTNEISNAKVEWGEGVEIDPTDNEIDDIDHPEEFSFSQWTPNKKAERFYDLRGDTRVNNMMSEHEMSQGLVMIDPDAEIFSHNMPQDYYKYEGIPQRLETLE